MTDDTLRDLGKQLPVDRPDGARRDKVRASLLAAAAVPAAPSSRRWLLVGGGFAAGALAAAAAVMLLVRPGEESSVAPAHEAYAHIESSAAAQLEHTMVPSATGTDEVVRVKAGTVRLAVPPTRAGDRVRVATGDAEIEGSGAYEVVVEADRIAAVTVTSGSATLRIAGQQQAVFLAAGQTWRASVQTAELAISPDPIPTPTPTPIPASSPNTTPPPAPIPSSPSTSADSDGAPPIKTTFPGDPNPTPSPTTTTAPTTTATPTRGRAPSPIADADELPLETSLVDPAPVREPVRTPRKASSNPKTTDSGAPIETELTPDPPAPAPAMTVEKPPAPVVNPVNETEGHFRAGAAALRANRLAEAATELAAAAAGEGPLAVDARYYQAVALIRAKRGAEAERALVLFLDKAPASSTRRGRAAIMLAKLIADRGDAAGARAWYELAAKDADPAVAAAAKAALR